MTTNPPQSYIRKPQEDEPKKHTWTYDLELMNGRRFSGEFIDPFGSTRPDVMLQIITAMMQEHYGPGNFFRFVRMMPNKRRGG